MSVRLELLFRVIAYSSFLLSGFVFSSPPLFDRQENIRDRFGGRFGAEIAFAVDPDTATLATTGCL
jgi:hypothetical protein